MSVISKKNVLTGIRVSEAMRRQVVRLDSKTSLDQCIRHTIKYKVNAVLITDSSNGAAGVVSKTDLMGAYYAGLPLETPLESIMVGPPLLCAPEDPLEKALEKMKENRVHRLYVSESKAKPVAGVLAYPDIVGLLYRICGKCKRSVSIRSKTPEADSSGEQILAKEIMTATVKAHNANETLFEVMEGLSEYRFGAVLIRDGENNPAGVVSKTDLIVAYRHGVSADSAAGSIMKSPVRACREDDYIARVIRRMIFSEVHRLFVRSSQDDRIVGVVSLTDAAKVRSGSCKACTASRFLTPKNG